MALTASKKRSSDSSSSSWAGATGKVPRSVALNSRGSRGDDDNDDGGGEGPQETRIVRESSSRPGPQRQRGGHRQSSRRRPSKVRRRYDPAYTAAKGGERQYDILHGRYGNYHHYYARRHTSENVFACDPRCMTMKEDWIRGKDCLDLGCNEGPICVELASEYKPRTMVGIDVDAELIRVASRRLEDKKSLVRGEGRHDAEERLRALDNTAFIHTDFMRWNYEERSYDTVMCFSVVKWVHLCYGDKGIRDLFELFSKILRVGGILCLEYQAWNSYKNSKKKGELKQFFSEDCSSKERLFDPSAFEIKPQDFTGLLEREYGFAFLEESDKCTKSKHFKQRPMKMYKRLPDGELAGSHAAV
ncbi:Bin3-type S-adenosyl-L-methionine methyltransferase [Chloropicon primus]|uniref:RNA methyltransferase n=1 Tax=Chloropicon primus TaxID=1764295 RepID=A0A5B8MTI7_9CHLO|nr:Bin3-type S-adenosyl-L-methionine methyltransferase [Chloropicon primus]UPR01946.1 Bin3-type S-adenosyl-L-methionine methyltransferase [Chloropicon primus]|mmetsp:Transcript_8622/g.24656  ORF Transcript_8622/g.24656 Transcript_8622/m.24656 type:complete len:359 (-) Transcript_8622:72-1148(-)|eukprot:QDZ22722.1 Bin3-type S-adenosyl-L-methionine methyltransferase [Chloropicon primus]